MTVRGSRSAEFRGLESGGMGSMRATGGMVAWNVAVVARELWEARVAAGDRFDQGELGGKMIGVPRRMLHATARAGPASPAPGAGRSALSTMR